LSSDEEEVEDEDEVDEADEGDSQEEDEDEDDEEEEEEVEPERPAGQHTRFDHDLADMLTPPRTSGRCGRTPFDGQAVSPIASSAVPGVSLAGDVADVLETGPVVDTKEIVEDVQESAEEDEEAEQPLEGGYPFSPMAIIESEPGVQPIAEDAPTDASSVIESSIQGQVDGFNTVETAHQTVDIDVEAQQYEIEIE